MEKEITFQAIRNELMEEEIAKIKNKETKFLFFVSMVFVAVAVAAKILQIDLIFFVAILFFLVAMFLIVFVNYFWKIPSPKISDAEVKSKTLKLYKKEKDLFLVALEQKNTPELEKGKKRIKDLEAILGLNKR